jgi:hypothetical protein
MKDFSAKEKKIKITESLRKDFEDIIGCEVSKFSFVMDLSASLVMKISSPLNRSKQQFD